VTRGATIYVVDDDVSVRRSLGRLLAVEGFRVVAFASATEFQALPILEHPMCLILDLRMPGMTGFDLLRALDAANREVPVILMTGHGNDSVLEDPVTRNVVALLMKPFEATALLNAVREALSRDRASARSRT
jgi:FixJ family two-component response regulator